MLSFGLPAALGASFSGATSAPGADFFGDAEFLGSFVSLRRPENMLKNLWLGMDQMRMGLDPMGDPVFRQQLARWAAPGSMYRFMDVLDGDITAPTTGRPMVRDLKMWPDVLMQMSGFTSARIERERQLYERMLRDKSERQRTVQLFGEAYYRASLENDQDMMMDILRTAEVRRIDVSSIMQSAAKRARDDQVDMFGRRIPKDVLERYPETLGVSGE